MDFANIPLALFAGLFSILSPCVLPLVPVVLGAAVAEHRFGPVALAAGLATSFTAVGLFVATIGYSIGLDDQLFRTVGAVLLIAVGLVLVVPGWQLQLAGAAGPLSGRVERKFGVHRSSGLRGQFGVGLLLGAAWSPCVGPTLGAASVLAVQGRDLGRVALTMLMFGLGSAIPLLGLGLLSREALMRRRGHLILAGKSGKMLLGGLLVTAGGFVLLGFDRKLEASLLQIIPQSIQDWSGRF